MSAIKDNNGILIPFEKKENYSILAVDKITKELKTFSGGTKESTVSKFVASTLIHFCEEQERFAKVVYKTPRTLSHCCAEIMSGCGNQISDIDVYRGAVKSYFPNADIAFKMEIQINGEDPTEEELTRKPKKTVKKVKKNAESEIKTKTKVIQKEKKEKSKKVKKSNIKTKTEIMQLSLFEE